MSDQDRPAHRILVAEDVEVISFVMTQMLLQAGYTVEVAENADTSRQIVRSW